MKDPTAIPCRWENDQAVVILEVNEDQPDGERGSRLTGLFLTFKVVVFMGLGSGVLKGWVLFQRGLA